MKRATFFYALILLAVFSNANAQRIDKTINSGWLFHKGEVKSAGEMADFDDWTRINLPHTWNSEDAFDDEKGFYQGEGWYAKALNVPDDWKSKQVFLHFEGANQVTEVFVNGQNAGTHRGGYTAFRFEISSLLNFGANNLLTVRVNNVYDENIPPLRADYTFYGGIYRNVRLIVTEPLHFDMDNHASDGVFTLINGIDKNRADVSVSGRIVNTQNQKQRIRVETRITDHNQKVVVSDDLKLNLAAGKSFEFKSGNLVVQNPNLWSPDNPYLYKVTMRIYNLGNNEAILDEIILPLGLRWFEFDDQNRFVLNGEPLKLIGSNRHQDLPGKGNALTDDDHRNDFKHIKEMGFNFVRLAHYPQAKEVYRACDELGLLVWSEIPVVNQITQTDEFTNNCLNMQREHIRQTRNHPGVVFYGYMNEALINMLGNNKRLSDNDKAQIAGATVDLAKKLEALSKQEAPDRKTVMAIHYHEGYNQYGLADVTDVLGWNLYFGWYYQDMEDLSSFLADQHKRYPHRPLIISEYGPGADIRLHTQSPKPWDYSEEYQVIMHESYLEQMMKTPYLAGFAAWNFADFGSERRQDAIPHVNQKGLVNYDRSEKEVCHLYRAYFSKEPFLHVALSNHTRQSGSEDENGSGVSTHPVRIFSNGKEVELLLNGESLGKKRVNPHTAVFDVPFVDGPNVLEAIDNNGLKDKMEVDFELYSLPLAAGEPKEIAVNVGAQGSFFDTDSKVLWMADREYTPGLWGYEGGAPLIKTGGRLPKTGISNDILGTSMDPLFQTFNEGIESYRFDVKDGLYEVTVCFVEPDSKNPEEEIIYNLANGNETDRKAGTRVFSMTLNDIPVLNDLNLAREYGPLRGVVYKFRVSAEKSEGVKVRFIAVEGQPVLSGIRIRPL